MGEAFTGIRKSTLYPCVGMKHEGDSLVLRSDRMVSHVMTDDDPSSLTSEAVFGATTVLHGWERYMQSRASAGSDAGAGPSASSVGVGVGVGVGGATCDIPTGMVREAFGEYLRLSRRRFDKIHTRAGVWITVDRSIAGFVAAFGSDIQPVLCTGDSVRSPRGVVTIAGSAQGCVWYTVDGDPGSWCWSRSDFVSLVNSGQLELCVVQRRVFLVCVCTCVCVCVCGADLLGVFACCVVGGGCVAGSAVPATLLTFPLHP